MPAKDYVDDVENLMASLLGLSSSDHGGGLSGLDNSCSTDGNSGSDGGESETCEQVANGSGSGGGESDAAAGPTSTTDDFTCVTKNLEFDYEAYRHKFGDTPYDVAVTRMFARYAQLVDRLTGTYHCRKPMSVAEGEVVAALARSFVLDLLTPILGKFFSTKVHKLLAHVLSAIRLHGSIKNGDTGANEALHGHEKRRYGRTNGDEDTFRGQLLRIGQGSLEIRDRFEREAADFDAWFDDHDDAAGAPGTLAPTSVPPDGGRVGGRASRRWTAVTVAQLAARPGLSAVGSVLGLPLDTALLRLPN